MKEVQNNKRQTVKRAFTLLELLVVIAIIGILIGMFLPATRRVREAARRTECLNNLKQLGLACHNYELAHGNFPSAFGGESLDQSGRISGWVSLLPFLELESIYQQISQPAMFHGQSFPPMPAPWMENYDPWKTEVPFFECPSTGPADADAKFAVAHYAFSVGDQARGLNQTGVSRGVFARQSKTQIVDIEDGCSNTVMLCEIGRSQPIRVLPRYAIRVSNKVLEEPVDVLNLIDESGAWTQGTELSPFGRGSRWSDGAAGPSLFNTILPPGSPSASVGGPTGADGLYSAGGPHPETVSCVLADGSTHSIGTEINTGNLSAPTPTIDQMKANVSSPYGPWGALGTIAGGEPANAFEL